jgi:phosphonate transport system permease protein
MSSAAHATAFGLARVPGRLRFLALVIGYAALVALCLGTFIAQGELSGGRNPWANLVRSVGEFSRPSFVDLWFGERRVEYRSDDGTLLRV